MSGHTLETWGVAHGRVPTELLRDPQISAQAKFTAALIDSYADAGGENAFPSIPTLARNAGASERTMQNWCRELRDAGWVEVEVRKRENGQQSSNRYRLLATCAQNASRGGAACFTPPVQPVAPQDQNQENKASEELTSVRSSSAGSASSSEQSFSDDEKARADRWLAIFDDVFEKKRATKSKNAKLAARRRARENDDVADGEMRAACEKLKRRIENGEWPSFRPPYQSRIIFGSSDAFEHALDAIDVSPQLQARADGRQSAINEQLARLPKLIEAVGEQQARGIIANTLFERGHWTCKDGEAFIAEMKAAA